MKVKKLDWEKLGVNRYRTEIRTEIEIPPYNVISYGIGIGANGIYLADYNNLKGTSFYYVNSIKEAKQKGQELFNELVDRYMKAFLEDDDG